MSTSTVSKPKKATKREMAINALASRENTQKINYLGYVFIAYYNNQKEPCLAIFGKRGFRPLVNYRFKQESQRNKYFQNYQSRIKQQKEAEEKRQKEALESFKNLKEGDIFYCSWGFEQTNIDFYKVVGFKGKKTVIFQEIGGINTPCDRNHMQGTTVPNPDHLTSNKKTCRVDKYGGFKISEFEYLRPWDGKAKRYSTYA